MQMQDLAGLSQADMIAKVQALMAENAKLKTVSQGKLTCKVSAKGAVSVYGFGKWPVTLYRSQWERLAKHMSEIEAFIDANASSLAVKGEVV